MITYLTLTATLLCTTAFANLIADPGQMTAKWNEVRSDTNPTNWLRYGYDGKTIVYDGSGENYDEFLSGLRDDNRAYGYVRFDIPGSAAKFAFITWIGPAVSPLKKARVSTDKAFVKERLTSFAKEILADEKSDLTKTKVENILKAASGAAYGTGK